MEARSEEEKEFLFQIFGSLGQKERELLKKQKVNVKWVGSEVGLPAKLVDFFKGLEEEFRFEDSSKWLVLAINYG